MPTVEELLEYPHGVTPLAIDKMTIEEKLQTMEALWNDLCQHEEALPVHDWQQEILDGRERMIERGDSKFSDWEEAKKHIAMGNLMRRNREHLRV